jgi:hypothetical protein
MIVGAAAELLELACHLKAGIGGQILEDNVAQFSYTKIDTFKKCPRRYYLKYIKGIKEEETDALRIGNEGHKWLEDYYSHHTIAEPSELLFDYPEFSARADVGMISQVVETEYKKQLGEDIIVGKIDLLATYELGKQIIIDHKFKGQWAETAHKTMMYDDQPKIYSWLTGVPWFSYNFIRTKAAKTRPKYERTPAIFITDGDRQDIEEDIGYWIKLIKHAEKQVLFPRCSGPLAAWCSCRLAEHNFKVGDK